MGYNQPRLPCREFPNACAPRPSSTACSRTRARPSPATSIRAIRKLSATPARLAPVAVIGFTNSSAATAAITTAPMAITSTAANAPSAKAASPARPYSILPCSAGRSLRSPAAFLRRHCPALLRKLSRACPHWRVFVFPGIQIRQERRQNSDRRQERTHVVHKTDVRRVRQFSQQRRADSAQPKRQPKERSRNRSHFCGHQLLRKNQNGGKRRRQNQSNHHAQNSRPKQIRVRQDQRKWQHAQNRIPDHHFASHAVANRPAKKRPRRHRAKKRKQMNLRAANRNVKFVHQIKCVIRPKTRQIKIFREHQRNQNRQGPHNLFPRQMRMRLSVSGFNNMPSQRRRRRLQFLLRSATPLRPSANIRKQNDSQERNKRKPRNATLPPRQNKCGQQRPHSRSRVSANLKQRLRHPVLPARSHPRNARRLRMKNRRPHAHQPRRNQNGAVTRRQRQRHQADQRNPHADRQKLWFVMFITVQSNQRLQERCSESSSERDQPDLPKIETKRIAQQRINRRQQRLHRVIKQMTKTNSQQNLKNSFRPRLRGNVATKDAYFTFARHFAKPAPKEINRRRVTRETATLKFISLAMQFGFPARRCIRGPSCYN